VVKGPDFSSHLLYNNMADDAEKNAARAADELAEMKTTSASKFPKIHLTEIVESSPKSVDNALAKMRGFGEDGGKIVKVTRLPESAVKEVAKKKLAGGLLAAASVASMAVSIEEIVYGNIANKISGGSKRLGNHQDDWHGAQ
jgi:hypothetical protein